MSIKVHKDGHLETDQQERECVKRSQVIKEKTPSESVSGSVHEETDKPGETVLDDKLKEEPVESSQTEMLAKTQEIRLRKLVDERENLIEQVKRLKDQLEQKKQKNGTEDASSPEGDVLENGADSNIMDIQRDANRQINDLRFKLVKSEQEVTALEQNLRSALDKIEELESSNSHLSKRLEKMKCGQGTATTP
ncbi:hypothetical protein cypCar_00037919 [Cyprinus carpio]|nr:hypothetical protein cypCar_00037919 [Cyprinus carpio]